MSFIFNQIFREIRSSWKRLLFFFLCIAIGVGSVVALRSLIGNLSKAVAGDARSLLTADIDISSTSPFSPNELSIIEDVLSKYKSVEKRNEVYTTSTMLRSGDNFQFVELKGIEEGFPLVGEFFMSNGKPFEMSYLENQGAVVESSLLETFKTKIGAKILIGRADFEIRGTFEKEPGASGGFRAGPRVFIERKNFDVAGLTRLGSRVRRRILLKTNEDPTQLVAELRQALNGTILTASSYKESQENLSDQFARVENYFSLVGLLILVLGGIGVWNVSRAFIEQKRKTVAILKCLGAKNYKILSVYLSQILALGLIGSLFGALLAQISLWLVKYRFADVLPENMVYSLSFQAALQGVFLGVLISLIFSLLPLLQIRTIKPILLLADFNNERLRRLDFTKWLVGFLSLTGLLGLAVWQAGSFKIGISFLIGLFLTSIILYVSAIFLTKSLKGLKNLPFYAVSQAINSLYRPGNQTRIVMLAVGLGVFVLIAVNSLQSNLLKVLDITRNQVIPGLYIIEIQPSNLEDIKKLVESETKETVKPIPIIRMRIAEIDGKVADFNDRENRRSQNQLTREFATTFRYSLEGSEMISEGEFWEPTPSSEPEVSVAEDIRNTLKIEIGSSITFDVLGRRITAKVTSFRRLDVTNTRVSSLFVFRPGFLEKAPKIFIIPVTKKLDQNERKSIQKVIVDKYPEVQVFDLTNILETVNRLLNNFVLAVSFVGSFVILTGILILIGSIALTKSQRVYENAILKTLGAKRNYLLTILFTEYAVLGCLSALIGAFFATLLSFFVTKYIFNINWEFDLLTTSISILITILIVTLVGVIASLSLIFKKPLATLRSQ